jgi:hypothetical protein
MGKGEGGGGDDTPYGVWWGGCYFTLILLL